MAFSVDARTGAYDWKCYETTWVLPNKTDERRQATAPAVRVSQKGKARITEWQWCQPRDTEPNEVPVGTSDTKSAKPPGQPPAVASQKRFDVALSFPGEKRDFVAEVAEQLARTLGWERVFYDKFFEAELARPDLDTHLQTIYHDQSELIVVFLCKEYEQKDWCGLELRAIRDLIKKRQAHIMPFRFDDTEISGFFTIDGYIDLRRRTPSETATLILNRLGAKR